MYKSYEEYYILIITINKSKGCNSLILMIVVLILTSINCDN